MQVPYLDLGRPFRVDRERYLAIVDRVWSSGKIFFGEDTRRLENQLAEFCGRRHAIGVGSCTDALYFSLLAAGVGPGDKVAVTAFSHAASLSCILRVGATPVFVDIDPQHFMMDMDHLEKLLPLRLKAIVAVHMYGRALDIERVEAFAEKHGLIVIEDAAQSFAATHNKRRTGSLGAFSCFSFDPLKTLASFGYGGMVLTDDSAGAELIDRFRHHGRGSRADVGYDVTGFNSKIPAVDAAVVSLRLEKLPDEIAGKKKMAAIYKNTLVDIKEITLPEETSASPHTWHKFTILADRRDELADHLLKNGVQTRQSWKRPLYREKMFRGEIMPLPGTEEACRQLLCLPLFPYMQESEAHYVAEKIAAFYTQ